MSSVSVTTSAQFSGSGYLELRGSLLPHKDTEEVIELRVTTTQAEGLIFWLGQGPDVPGSGKDFLALAIRDGHVIFRLVIDLSLLIM